MLGGLSLRRGLLLFFQIAGKDLPVLYVFFLFFLMHIYKNIYYISNDEGSGALPLEEVGQFGSFRPSRACAFKCVWEMQAL